MPLAAAGQFSPDGGLAGSVAVHKDSARYVGWASTIRLQPGYLDVAQPAKGRVPTDSTQLGIGVADGRTLSLGDGGAVVLGFVEPIADGPGFDFVVFENSFSVAENEVFAELAFVEASSDGVTFVRFPNSSLTVGPIGSFGTLDPRMIDGLAGRFSAPYGTGFDVADLPAVQGFDASRIMYVRLIDVIGTADVAFAKTDSEGAIVYDPYPTPFPSCGFDLDAVGVLHVAKSSSVEELFAEVPAPMRCYVITDFATLPFDGDYGPVSWVDMLGTRFGESPHPPRMSGHYVALAPDGRALYRVLVQL